MFQFILKKLRRFFLFTVALFFVLVFLILIILYINYNMRKQYTTPSVAYDYIMENKSDDLFFGLELSSQVQLY